MTSTRMTYDARPLLQVKNLDVKLPTNRGTVHAVNQVSLELTEGKTLGIVGESGCGKSVLCRALLGLLPRTAQFGKDSAVYFNGQNLLGRSERQFNQVRGVEMAMVFQDPLSSLNPVLPIGKQIAETLILHKHMKAQRARKEALALLRAVGVPGPAQRADHYPHQLSGGMRQRVAIAIALACKPQLLIADEPTTALDMTVQAEILDLLCRLQDERKMAMILVTHDLNITAGRAHEVAVMYAGRIVEQATAATLFSQMRMPYTRALTASIPRLDTPPHVLLHSIDGQPPDLTNPIKGCAFAPRCTHARSQCNHQPPPLRPEPEPHHRLACWYPVRGSLHA